MMHLTRSDMNLAQRTILGSATNDSHEFEVLDHSIGSSNRGGVSLAFAKKKKDLHNRMNIP